MNRPCSRKFHLARMDLARISRDNTSSLRDDSQMRMWSSTMAAWSCSRRYSIYRVCCCARMGSYICIRVDILLDRLRSSLNSPVELYTRMYRVRSICSDCIFFLLEIVNLTTKNIKLKDLKDF